MLRSHMIEDEIWMAPLISEEWPAGIFLIQCSSMTGVAGTASKLEDSEHIPQNGAGWVRMRLDVD